MSQLSEMFVARFAESSTLSTALGSLWHGMAPANAAFPYAVFYDLGGKVKHTFSGSTFQYPDVQISIFAVSGTALKTYQEALHEHFDRVELTDGDVRVTVVRDNSFTRGPEIGKNGTLVYTGISRFRCFVQNAP